MWGKEILHARAQGNSVNPEKLKRLSFLPITVGRKGHKTTLKLRGLLK